MPDNDAILQDALTGLDRSPLTIKLATSADGKAMARSCACAAAAWANGPLQHHMIQSMMVIIFTIVIFYLSLRRI
jgi:hypothetical protein